MPLRLSIIVYALTNKRPSHNILYKDKERKAYQLTQDDISYNNVEVNDG